MRALTILAMLGFFIMTPAHGAPSAASDTTGWTIYHDEPDGYEFAYPDTLSLSTPTSSSGKQSMLTGPDVVDGKTRIAAMQFIIQRGINPQRLPIRQWYEALAQRSLDPASETVTSVGGRMAIRRGPVARVHGVGEKIDSSSGTASKNMIYVPLNSTDVLTISILSQGRSLSELYDKVLSTLRFF